MVAYQRTFCSQSCKKESGKLDKMLAEEPKPPKASPIDVVYFGNPLIDITVSDPDREILERYNL